MPRDAIAPVYRDGTYPDEHTAFARVDALRTQFGIWPGVKHTRRGWILTRDLPGTLTEYKGSKGKEG